MLFAQKHDRGEGGLAPVARGVWHCAPVCRLHRSVPSNRFGAHSSDRIGPNVDTILLGSYHNSPSVVKLLPRRKVRVRPPGQRLWGNLRGCATQFNLEIKSKTRLRPGGW